jgi:hypothetical protein
VSALQLLELDVDEIRARLLVETNEALTLADELALATQTDEPVGRRQRIAANYGQVRNRMRALRSLLRVEEGCR